MKKIILAATTLILASTLSNGFAASDLSIQTEKLYISKNETNAIKFNNKNGRYSVVGLYYAKKTKTLGTWRGENCNYDDYASTLACNFKSTDNRKGTITFRNHQDHLSSITVYINKSLPNKTHTWHEAQ